MPVGKTDKYANILQESVTMSATDTLTFQEINIGLNIFDKVGLLLHRIQFDPAVSFFGEMVAITDYVRMALSQSNTISSLSINERAVIDLLELGVVAHGTPASAALVEVPLTRSYTDLPGGGILIAPRPLYFALSSSGFAAPLTVVMRVYFTIIQLKDSDYLELIESRRFFS